MLFLLASAALAQDPVDIGVIKNEDIRVVQKVLYFKEDRTEFGAHVGIMPFDGATFSPQLALTAGRHFSETFAIEAQLGGGYGFKTGEYREEEQVLGIAREAYRYLGSLQVDAQWSPIYAKANLGGKKIVHFDVYGLAGLGATLEQSVFPSAEITVAPTLPIGLGARWWMSNKLALRTELRDNMMVEYRAQSQTWGFKQNAALTVGIVGLTGGTP